MKCLEFTESGDVIKGGDPAARNRESLALSVFRHGSVRLVAPLDATGTFRMKQVLPGTSLAQHAVDDDAAVRIVGSLINDLHRDQRISALRTPTDLPALVDVLRPLREVSDARLPVDLVRSADSLGRQLVAEENKNVVLHGDLHHGNILWSQQHGRWLAIDPHGWWGDPVFEAAPLLCSPASQGVWGDARGCDGAAQLELAARRIAILAEVTGFAKERLWSWTFVGCVLAEARMLADYNMIHGAPLGLARRLADRKL